MDVFLGRKGIFLYHFFSPHTTSFSFIFENLLTSILFSSIF